MKRVIKSLISTLLGMVIIMTLITGCSNNQEPLQYDFPNAANGCVNFMVYSTGDMNAALTIVGNKSLLNLSTNNQVLELPNENLEVQIDVFDGPIGNFYCDDAIGDEGMIIESHAAISGSLEIQIDTDVLVENEIYQISIKVNNVEFLINGSNQVIEKLLFEDVVVGWLPG